MHNLELVQMAHAKDKRPAEISGGMKQRVGLARALAMEPKVLLLDEPFGALDALTRAHLQDLVMAIHQKLGNTVLMITHDVDEAVLLSDRIVMMTNGPAAHIGEVLDVPLPRPRRRLELAANQTYLNAASASWSSSTSVTALWKRLEDLRCRRTSPRNRNAIWKASLPACRSRATAAARRAARPARASRAVPTPNTSRAQDRVVAAGGKLADQEKFKREQHPFDAYERLKEQADEERMPQARRQFPLALLRPVLCRAGAELLHVPAAHAERHPQALAASPASPTSPSATAAAMPMSRRAPICRSARSRRKTRSPCSKAIQDLGLCSRGSGADNIRNVTGTPTAGIDPQELIDTRPYAREWHFHILNERALYGLPRKFNVAFDGGGIIPVLEDTNDIGFQAVEVKDGFGVEPGVWFRLDARRHHRPQGFCPRHRRDRQAGRRDQGGRRASCACSSTMATAPTATRRG